MSTPYRINCGPTGFGTQRRIIVTKETLCGEAKWDDVVTPTIASARRTLCGMRKQYGVKRVRHWPTPDALAAGIWSDRPDY